MDKLASQALAAGWKRSIECAKTAKKEFQADADEGMRFYDGPYTWLYGTKEQNQRGDFAFINHTGDMPRPKIMMTVNKAAELVQLFGPSLYHQNPYRSCSPPDLPDLPSALFGNPNDPMTQMMVQPVFQQLQQWQVTGKSRSILMQSVLNYFPGATDLETEFRRGVNEALIKGMAVFWTEVYRPIGAKHKIIGTFWDNVDNYLKDPDATCQEDVKWIARRFVKPIWEFERKFGLPDGSIQGNRKSNNMAAATSTTPTSEDESRRKTGKTNDLIVYWQIWSKMGLGGMMREIDASAREADRYGQYVQFVVAEECDYLVNLPESVWGNEDDMYRRCQWETPQWADAAWPCEELAFHEKPGSIWPISHLKPALGELKLINWAFSFLATRMWKTSRDFIAVMKSLPEEMKRVIQNGSDLEFIEIEVAHGKSVDQLVKFLQHPEINKDFWQILQALLELFDKRTGLGELMYGMTEHQYRSAAEADVKSSQTSIRPDDMAKTVEKVAGKVATREAIAAKWHLNGHDIAAIFGPTIGGLWDKLIGAAPLEEVVHQLQFSVAAGSARKRNKQKDSTDADTAIQNFAQLFIQAYTMTGDPTQINALIVLWGKANDRDVSEMMFKPIPIMPAPPASPSDGGQPPPAA